MQDTIDRQIAGAQALTTDTSILTAVGNDHGFERLFARHVRKLTTIGLAGNRGGQHA